MRETQVRFLGQEDLLGKEMQSTPALLPGKYHGWRSLIGYRPWVAMSRTWLSDFTSYGMYQKVWILKIIPHFSRPGFHRKSDLNFTISLFTSVRVGHESHPPHFTPENRLCYQQERIVARATRLFFHCVEYHIQTLVCLCVCLCVCIWWQVFDYIFYNKTKLNLF